MQHLNGMELVALSIQVDQDRPRKELIRFMKLNWADVILAVSVVWSVLLSIL